MALLTRGQLRQRLTPDMAVVTPNLCSLFDCLGSVTPKLPESCHIQSAMQTDIAVCCSPYSQGSLLFRPGGNGLIPAVSETQ